MDMLMLSAAINLILIILLAVYVFVDLAGMPGRIAYRRGHVQPEAVRIAGLTGMLLGGVFWPIALVWAFFTPPNPKTGLPTDPDTALPSEVKQTAGSDNQSGAFGGTAQ